MAGGIDWFRWHHGSVTDPKFSLVARRAGCSLPDVLAVWAYLLERASAAEMRGEFGEVDWETVDNMFGFEDGVTSAILTHMNGRDLIAGGRIVAWEKRQPKRERDPAPIHEDAPQPMTSTERSRKHRAAKSGQTEPDDAMQRHATPCNASDDQETPIGEERREDTSTSLRSVEGASKRASRKCPPTFEVDDELRQWAASSHPAVNLQAETEKLRDHTFKAAISDWRGAWRNWIRRADENAPKARGSPPAETAYQRSMRERMAEFAGPSAAKAPPAAPRQTQLAEVIDVTPRLVG